MVSIQQKEGHLFLKSIFDALGSLIVCQSDKNLKVSSFTSRLNVPPRFITVERKIIMLSFSAEQTVTGQYTFRRVYLYFHL